jgi:hypothetical protein
MPRSSVSISYQPNDGERLDVSADAGSSDEFTFEAMCATAVKAFSESLTAAVAAYRDTPAHTEET